MVSYQTTREREREKEPLSMESALVVVHFCRPWPTDSKAQTSLF